MVKKLGHLQDDLPEAKLCKRRYEEVRYDTRA